ncbi:MAG: agmatine deiminase family protein [Candidatus Acidiferrales bacterium]|jgi:agmatine deiminase
MARLKPKSKSGETPLEMGFRMPAEWEPHEATWLAWPHERTDWPGKFAPVPWVYADIVRVLSRVERVRILVADGKEKRLAQDALKNTEANLSAVDFYVVPTNRGWIRDFGPIFVKKDGHLKGDDPTGSKGEIGLTKWRFNAWAKYDNWKRDDAAVKKVAPRLNMRVWEAEQDGRPIVLEGGSIDVNGRGTMLTTEECLLSAEQARNPGLTRENIERIFRDYFAVTNVLWLNRGIAGDDTHGHVDDLARFVNPTTVVTVVEEDPSDVNYELLQENLARLREMKDQDGRPLRIETLPMPQPVIFAGQRLPASYANFYIANGTVLVPTFNDANDRLALETLAALFPGRAVIGIACRDLVLGLGTLHCMTQQQPA